MKKLILGSLLIVGVIAFATADSDTNTTKCGNGKCSSSTPVKCGEGKCGSSKPDKTVMKCGAGKCGGGN